MYPKVELRNGLAGDVKFIIGGLTVANMRPWKTLLGSPFINISVYLSAGLLWCNGAKKEFVNVSFFFLKVAGSLKTTTFWFLLLTTAMWLQYHNQSLILLYPVANSQLSHRFIHWHISLSISNSLNWDPGRMCHLNQHWLGNCQNNVLIINNPWCIIA